ncbi:Kynurenine 3-monooxygenase [Rickettsiales endosymbiont of Trichoplax sp. H2]|nr:Kynurenine 3-monooxygenase [Rickettsiales endosymbiont of Trichoplax sp. H2]
MSKEDCLKKITIIGAGLVGLLLGILLGKRGYSVQIYENKDQKHTFAKLGKSINLTLCKRGINALKKAGIIDEVQKLWVPVYGGCLHLNESQIETQLYGNYGEALYSISRQELNTLLLSIAQKTSGVSIIFGMKCVGYDLSKSTIFLIDKNQHKTELPFNTLIAADGIYSAIRSQMQRSFGFNYSQFYSKHVNKELTIPTENAKKYKLKQNYIHIWPRNESMIIAFPNSNDSFTCTLQLPVNGSSISFKKLNSESEMFYYFKKLFPDAIALIPKLAEEFFQNPEIPMMTVRCSPWHIKDKVLLIGDSAHGVWPSYGQGANAGFEDCEILIKCMEQYPDNLLASFVEFQEKRKANLDTIADLSETHFNEIRHLVADPNFLLRKRIERKMNLLFPSEYFSLYSRIAFTIIPYKQAVKLESFYCKIIDELLESQEIISDPDSNESEKLIYKIYKKYLANNPIRYHKDH